MTAAHSEDSSAQDDGLLTIEDLERFFPEDGKRRELVDGVLLVSPSPTNAHQLIAALLTSVLHESRPAELVATQGVDIRMGKRRSFIPDVLVITADAAQHRRRMYEPHEVMLAVEIVSEGSQAIDRVLKPNLYAEVGIPYYWRIEIEHEKKIIVHTYRLAPGGEAYRESGTFEDRIKFPRPGRSTSRSPASNRRSSRARA